MRPITMRLLLGITVLVGMNIPERNLAATPLDTKSLARTNNLRRLTPSVKPENRRVFTMGNLAGSLNDSIQAKLKGLAIAGGESSNPRFVETPGQPSRVVADYLLNGIKYTLTMEKTGFIKLSTSTLLYQIKSLEDLPGGIQKFINERNKPNQSKLTSLTLLDEKVKQDLQRKNELIFESCSVFQLHNGAKNYRVYVNYYGLTTLPLIFDEQGNLVWVANFNRLESLKNLEDQTGGLTKIVDNDLTQFKSTFGAANEFKSFKLAGSLRDSDASQNIYGGVTGYEFNLVNSSESWHLSYSNSKTLVDGYYSGWVK